MAKKKRRGKERKRRGDQGRISMRKYGVVRVTVRDQGKKGRLWGKEKCIIKMQRNTD